MRPKGARIPLPLADDVSGRETLLLAAKTRTIPTRATLAELVDALDAIAGPQLAEAAD